MDSMTKTTRIGELRFCLDDYREQEYNESTDLTYGLYGTIDSEILRIDEFYYYCKCFALAMGFSPDTVNEWFEEY